MRWIVPYEEGRHSLTSHPDLRFPSESRAARILHKRRDRILESLEDGSLHLRGLIRCMPRGHRQWYHRPGVSLCVAGKKWAMLQRFREGVQVSHGYVKKPGQKPAQWYQATQKA